MGGQIPFVVFETDPEYYENRPREVIPKFWMGEVIEILDANTFKFAWYDCENSNVEKKWRKTSLTQESTVDQVLFFEHDILTQQHKIRKNKLNKIESIISDLEVYDEMNQNH